MGGGGTSTIDPRTSEDKKKGGGGGGTSTIDPRTSEDKKKGGGGGGNIHDRSTYFGKTLGALPKRTLEQTSNLSEGINGGTSSPAGWC